MPYTYHLNGCYFFHEVCVQQDTDSREAFFNINLFSDCTLLLITITNNLFRHYDSTKQIQRYISRLNTIIVMFKTTTNNIIIDDVSTPYEGNHLNLLFRPFHHPPPPFMLVIAVMHRQCRSCIRTCEFLHRVAHRMSSLFYLFLLTHL